MMALAAIETNSVAQGYLLADEIVKTADVDLHEANAICAGKFLAIFSGSAAAVRSALETARLLAADHLLFSELYLARVHDDVKAALCGACPEPTGALGMFESYSAIDALARGDEIAKSFAVRLVDIRLGRGLGGKSTVAFCGDLASCQLAAAELCRDSSETGLLSDVVVVPHPDAEALRGALPHGPGHACASCTAKGG